MIPVAGYICYIVPGLQHFAVSKCETGSAAVKQNNPACRTFFFQPDVLAAAQ